MPPTHRPRRTAAALRARFGDAPFPVRDALAEGVSPGQLRAAVAAGHVRSVRHGVLSVGAVPAELRDRHLEQIRAVLARIGAPAVVSHGSAAVLLGLPYPSIVPPDDDVPVELTGRAWEGRGSRDWVRHHADVDRDELVVRDGVRVTGLARAAVDVARTRRGPDALVVVDAALRRMIELSLDEDIELWDAVRSPRWVRDSAHRLVLVAERLAGAPGIVAARRWVPLGHPAADNALESYSRGVLLAAGVPPPIVGLGAYGDDGRTYWPDLAWPEFRVLAECDGRGKYTDPDVLYREKVRQEALERAGWVVVRWTWEEITYRPEVVVRRVVAALRARGWTG